MDKNSAIPEEMRVYHMPEDTAMQCIYKIGALLREIYEHESRSDIELAQKITRKLIEKAEIIKIAEENKAAIDKSKSLLKLWESMDFDFVDKDERWLQIGSEIKRHSLTNGVADTTERYTEKKYDELSLKVARLREVFQWPDMFDIDQGCSADHPKAWHLAEIVHSPDYCIDAMIRILQDGNNVRRTNGATDTCQE